MKKKIALLLTAAAFIMAAAGCSSSGTETQAAGAGEEVSEAEASAEIADASDLQVAVLLPGNRGDQSFFDLTYSCVPMIEEAYGIEPKCVEMGPDSAKWLPTLQDYGDLGYDIIISLNPASEQIQQAAEMYPDTMFFNVNGTCDKELDNLVAVTTLSNELSLFGGVAAALKAEELGEDTIGFVCGMDILDMNYFLCGYIEGAKWVNPDIKVVTSYVGSFTDPAKAKENALLLYDSGISVIYACAGGSGLGVMEAAAEQGKYTIGVDVDQYDQLKESSPEFADTIITSCVSQIPNIATNLVGDYIDGTVEPGLRRMGFADEAVGITINENTEKILGAEAIAEIEEYEQRFLDGELTCTSMFREDGSSLNEEDIAPIIDLAH